MSADDMDRPLTIPETVLLLLVIGLLATMGAGWNYAHNRFSDLMAINVNQAGQIATLSEAREVCRTVESIAEALEGTGRPLNHQQQVLATAAKIRRGEM